MDAFDELNKNLDVKLRLEKNELGEAVLACEGNFPTLHDRPVLKISAPPKDWWMLAKLDSEDWERIIKERFLIPALGIIRTRFDSKGSEVT